MADRYGTHYTSLPATKRGQGSRFLWKFENVRNEFNENGYDSYSLELIMNNLKEGDPNCVQYDPHDGEITLTSSVPCC